MNGIPRVIYQTWWVKTLPQPIQASVDSMIAMNPGYDYRLYDDGDMHRYVEGFSDSTLSRCFNSLKVGAAKADLWRYLVLYKEGGVYLDVDSVIYGKLDELIGDDECSIVSRENNPGRFVQWCLMFTPEHPILKICIESCLNNIKKMNCRSVLELTGPVVYSNAVNEFFGDSKVYYLPDDQINSLKSITGVRFHSHDYKGYAEFEHPNKNELYVNKPHWTIEQRTHFKDSI